MGLFARLLQPASTGRYCLPYEGDNPMMRDVLAASTEFLGHLRGPHSTEKKFGVVIGMLVVMTYKLSDIFKDHAKEVLDFSKAEEALFDIAACIHFTPADMYWHPQEKAYVKNVLNQFDKTVLAKAGNVPVTVGIYYFTKQLFKDALEARGEDSMSMQFTDRARNFILDCAGDKSDDDLLLMQLSTS